METLAALSIGIEIITKAQEALQKGQSTVDLREIGDRFSDVNARIQAAREPDPDEETATD